MADDLLKSVRKVLTFRRRALSPAGHEARSAYLFLLPNLFFFIVFQAIPIAATIGLTFTKYNLFSPPTFNGITNYRKLISDPRFLLTMTNTVIISLMYVGLITIAGLLVAVGVNALVSKMAKSIFRTVYFVPMMASFASVAIVWWFLLNPDFGIVNYYLSQVGLQPVPWTSSSRYAVLSVVFVGVWKNLGFDFVILLVALQQVPKVFIEAAMIDGANAWVRFTRITLPMISSSLLFCITINLIDGLQYFDVPQIMTHGGPGDATRTVVMYLYESGFRFFDMGYASTMAIVLLLLIMLLTLFQFAVARYWVFYEFDNE